MYGGTVYSLLVGKLEAMQRIQQGIPSVHAKGGACYICGNPADLVDTEVSIDYEGVLAICHGCAWDIAQTAGFRMEDEERQRYVQQLEDRLGHEVTQRIEAEEVITDLFRVAQGVVDRRKPSEPEPKERKPRRQENLADIKRAHQKAATR